jgi:cold shock CspA family protein
MIISRINLNKLLPAIILFSTVLVVVNGCSMSNYGKLKSNQEVTSAFEAYQILPDHIYYYRGTFSRPLVIAGIHKNFKLESKLWVRIDPKAEDFHKLIDRVSLQGSGNTAQAWGFTILDKAGNDVGVWYSAIRAAAVEIDETGQIVNLSPMRTVTRGNQGR